MKLSQQITHFPRILTIALLSILPIAYQAAGEDSQTKPAATQRLFASPDEAVQALRTATEAKDKAALAEIFGPELHDLLTGDEVQDANNAQHFAAAMAEGCN